MSTTQQRQRWDPRFVLVRSATGRDFLQLNYRVTCADGRRRRVRKVPPKDKTSKSSMRRWADEEVLRITLRHPDALKVLRTTFNQAIPDFLEDSLGRNKPATVYSDRAICRIYVSRFFGDLEVTDNDAVEMAYREFIRNRKQLGIGPKRFNGALSVVRRIRRNALPSRHHQNLVPMPPLKAPSPGYDYLTDEEFEAVLAAGRRHSDLRARRLLAAILISGELGLRNAEVRSLPWSNVCFAKRQLTVAQSLSQGELSSTKNDKIRHLPMSNRVVDALRTIDEGGVYLFPSANGRKWASYNWISDGLSSLCELAGVKRVSPHALRHTFCSSLAEGQEAVETIRQLAGHSSLRMVQRYTHIRDKTKREAIMRLESRRGNVRTKCEHDERNHLKSVGPEGEK